MAVIAHISGPSGSGKTTISKKIKKLYPEIIVQDLDDMDNLAADELFGDKPKKEYTDTDIKRLAKLRQELLDMFIKKHKNKSIVLVGHHTEGDTVLNVHTNNKWMLNTGPLTSAYRAYLRSQEEKPEHRRLLSELPDDYKEAKEVIGQLKELGYEKYSADEMVEKIGEMV